MEHIDDVFMILLIDLSKMLRTSIVIILIVITCKS